MLNPLNETEIIARINEINRMATERNCPAMKLTSAQENSLLAMHYRGSNIYSFYNDTLMGCIMAQSDGIVIGIEPDGYRHS